MPHPSHSSPCFLTSWNSSLYPQPAEIKSNRYGLLIYQSFEEKKTRPPIPAPTHCLKCQPYLPVEDKETGGVRTSLTEGLWQVKNTQIFFPLSFFSPRQCLGGQLNPRYWDTPGVVRTKRRRDTRAPLYRYTVISTLRCSTPTHQLPQCTRFRQKSPKISVNSGFLLFISDIFWFIMCLNTQRYTMYERNIFYLCTMRQKEPFVFTHNQL